MSTEVQTNQTAETKKREKKPLGTGLLILLIVFILLFLLTTAILGSRLYEMATRDQYSVALELGEPDGSVELFRVQYENDLNEVTVKGVNSDSVVAPGTSVSYDVRLRNNDDVAIDFLMTPTVEFLTGDSVPVEFKVMDTYGNYILGSETEWVDAGNMNALAHKGTIHPGEVFTYHVIWQWVFDNGAEQDQYDTYLGTQKGETVPGISVGISTEATANPTPVKSNMHMAHLLGDGFGCCWCCYLVWFLLLICLLLIIWVWQLKKKLNKLEKVTE